MTVAAEGMADLPGKLTQTNQLVKQLGDEFGRISIV